MVPDIDGRADVCSSVLDSSAPDLSGVADDARASARGIWDASAPARAAFRDRTDGLVSRSKSVDVSSRRKALAKQAKKARKQARRVADQASDLGRTAATKLPDVKLAR